MLNTSFIPAPLWQQWSRFAVLSAASAMGSKAVLYGSSALNLYIDLHSPVVSDFDFFIVSASPKHFEDVVADVVETVREHLLRLSQGVPPNLSTHVSFGSLDHVTVRLRVNGDHVADFTRQLEENAHLAQAAFPRVMAQVQSSLDSGRPWFVYIASLPELLHRLASTVSVSPCVDRSSVGSASSNQWRMSKDAIRLDDLEKLHKANLLRTKPKVLLLDCDNLKYVCRTHIVYTPLAMPVFASGPLATSVSLSDVIVPVQAAEACHVSLSRDMNEKCDRMTARLAVSASRLEMVSQALRTRFVRTRTRVKRLRQCAGTLRAKLAAMKDTFLLASQQMGDELVSAVTTHMAEYKKASVRTGKVVAETLVEASDMLHALESGWVKRHVDGVMTVRKAAVLFKDCTASLTNLEICLFTAKTFLDGLREPNLLKKLHSVLEELVECHVQPFVLVKSGASFAVCVRSQVDAAFQHLARVSAGQCDHIPSVDFLRLTEGGFRIEEQSLAACKDVEESRSLHKKRVSDSLSVFCQWPLALLLMSYSQDARRQLVKHNMSVAEFVKGCPSEQMDYSVIKKAAKVRQKCAALAGSL